MSLPRTIAFAITSASVLSIVFSLLPLLTNIFEKNECKMTVMWSPPMFWPFPMDHDKYHVYHYAEGVVTAPPLDSEPNEIPVLFIPGSGGSRNQVRSLASVMKKKKDLKNPDYTYRFFAVDFNQENTVLNGKMLTAQTTFAVDALIALRQKYHNRKVIVYGHSLGGTVAMGLLTDPRFNVTWVDLFILKSAPLERSPLLLDNRAREYYLRMHNMWKRKETNSVAVVSYSGGLKDFLVADSITRLGYVAAVPIWTIADVPDYGTDHLCMMWCNQVVTHASRLLEMYAEKRMSRTPREIARAFLEDETAKRDNKYTVKGLATEIMGLGERRSFRTPDDQHVVGVYVAAFQVVQVKTTGKCVRSVTQIRGNNFRNTRRNNGTSSIISTIARNHPSSIVQMVFELDRGCEFTVETSSWFSATCGLLFDLFVSESDIVLCTALFYLAFHVTSKEEEWEEHILVMGALTMLVLIPLLAVSREAFLMVPIVLGLILALVYIFVVDGIWIALTYIWPGIVQQRIDSPLFIDSPWKTLPILIIPPQLTNFVLICYFSLNKNIKKFLLSIPFLIPLLTQLWRHNDWSELTQFHHQYFFLGTSLLIYYVCSEDYVYVDNFVFLSFYGLSCFSFVFFDYVSLESISGFLLILLFLKYFQG